MAIFRRKMDPSAADRAAALAQRGVAGEATVLALRELGGLHGIGGGAREVELSLALTLADATRVEVVHRQRLTAWTGHGVAPGARVRVVYDRDDPHTLTVAGHVDLRTEVRDGTIVALAIRDVESPARG
jgi:hypothetical protein